MYTLSRAIAVEQGANKRWKAVDIRAIPIPQLLSTYRHIYTVLTHPSIIGELTLNVDDIVTDLQGHAGTFSNYLSSIGAATLPTTQGSPVIMTNQAIFSDAFAAGFHVDSIDHDVGEGVIVEDERRPDLIVTPVKEPIGYDYLGLRKRVLANVNGFYHNTAANSKGYYVINGNKTRIKSNKNYLGLLSFGTLGDLDILNITEDMLSYDVDAITGTVERVHIRFDYDLSSKVPMLILGGYMLLLDDEQLLLTSGTTLTFKTHRYAFAERYYESSPYLDFDGFDIPHSNDNPQVVSFNGFRKKPYLSKLFTMSQSFLVMVPAKNVITERKYPDVETVPHTYLSYERPKWPLVVCEGKHEVYWAQEEAGYWMIRCHDSYRYNYMFQTRSVKNILKIDDSIFPGDAGLYSPAYFLKLIEEVIQIKTA